MKLNLACGCSVLDGFVNVDANPARGVDEVVDLTKPFPWAANSSSYIFCSHFIEHLSQKEGVDFLLQCSKVLSSEGYMDIWTPDFDILVDLYIKSPDKLAKVPFFYQSNHSIIDFINWRIFGNVEGEEGMNHKYLYCAQNLTDMALKCGFSSLTQLNVEEHFLLEKYRHKGIQMGWRLYK